MNDAEPSKSTARWATGLLDGLSDLQPVTALIHFTTPLFPNKHLGSVDELVRKALGNALNVTEGSLAGTSRKKPDGLQSDKDRNDESDCIWQHAAVTDSLRSSLLLVVLLLSKVCGYHLLL